MVAAVVAVAATAAHAEPRVLIVETDALALPALATRIALHVHADVRTARDADRATLHARAPQLLAEHAATLVVWIDTAPNGYVVYVAGRWPDRALIELVRVDATTSSTEIERLVSLKIAGLLDAALSPQPAAVTLGAPAATPRDRWWFALGADAALGTADRAVSAGPSIAGELRWPGTWTLSARVAARVLWAGALERPRSTTSIDEYGLAARVELARGPWFAGTGLVGSLFAATASTSDGRRGSGYELVPTAELVVGVRLPVSASELVLSLGVEHAMIRQRFLVDGAVVGDLGRDRAVLRLAFALPIR